MRRRTLLLSTAALAAASGCSHSGGTQPASSPQPRTTGSEPVITWALTEGYTSAGRRALRPPRLVIYPDGQVIADATYRSDLSDATITDLVAKVAEDHKGPDPAKRKDGLSAVANTATTVFTVRTSNGTCTASAQSLDELRPKGGYPAALYDARDRIATVHQRVASSGQPYVSDQVLLVLEPLTSSPVAGVQPWPADLKLPAAAASPSGTMPSEVQTVTCSGQNARDVVRLIARDLDANGSWQVYRTSTGQLLRASWRYRLPNE
jgi:hypothetical protein